MKQFNNTNTVISVMYHYVREFKTSKFRDINFLQHKNFVQQINYFKKKFNIICINEILNLRWDKKRYKKPFLLMTFDDGYLDHYKYVTPTLIENKIKGLFFLPSKIFYKNSILDVNKIQFILSEAKDKNILFDDIKKILLKEYKININQFLKKKIIKNRFDKKNILILKRLLQHQLPKKIRNELINILFRKYVTTNTADFKKNLYLNKNHVNEMINFGMNFGSHSESHEWMEFLTDKEQKDEVLKSKKFFNKNFSSKNGNFKTFCYPYGSYNSETIQILKKNKYDMAFTTIPKPFFKKKKSNIFEFPRYDTNDFKVWS